MYDFHLMCMDYNVFSFCLALRYNIPSDITSKIQVIGNSIYCKHNTIREYTKRGKEKSKVVCLYVRVFECKCGRM